MIPFFLILGYSKIAMKRHVLYFDFWYVLHMKLSFYLKLISHILLAHARPASPRETTEPSYPTKFHFFLSLFLSLSLSFYLRTELRDPHAILCTYIIYIYIHILSSSIVISSYGSTTYADKFIIIKK
jgi:hypothetical protein